MCRGIDHVDVDARQPLAAVLLAIAGRLAAEYGVMPEQVRVGPVDFGCGGGRPAARGPAADPGRAD